MSIKISWQNVESVDSIKIYRSENPIALDALPAVYQNLPGGATFFVDPNVQRNKVYNYRIARVKGDVTVYSNNQAHGYFPDTGPGSQELLTGDWNCGYFGRVQAHELMTSENIRQELALRTNARWPIVYASPVGDNIGYWHKFVFEGKILFYPNGNMGFTTGHHTTTANYLYSFLEAGLLQGGLDVAETAIGVITNGTPTLKDFQFDRGDWRFRMRAPRITRDREKFGEQLEAGYFNTDPQGFYLNEELINSEFMKTVGASHFYTRIRNPNPALAAITIQNSIYIPFDGCNSNNQLHYRNQNNQAAAYEEYGSSVMSSNSQMRYPYLLLELIF